MAGNLFCPRTHKTGNTPKTQPHGMYRTMEGKNKYGLSDIRATRQDTSESWIGAIFFVMNLVKLLKIAPVIIFIMAMTMKWILFALKITLRSTKKSLSDILDKMKTKIWHSSFAGERLYTITITTAS